MKNLILLAAFAITSATVAGQKAIQKAVIQTPNLQCEVCKERIENHLVHEYGVSSVRADYHHHTVAVSWYVDRTNIENIKTALANMGYDADDVKADPDAYNRLPVTCQHLTHPTPKK